MSVLYRSPRPSCISIRSPSRRPVFLLHSLRRVRRWHRFTDRDRKGELSSAADASISSSGAEEEPDSPGVFPRIRERDPYRLLGLSREATFEEIQDARNFYYDTYRSHDPSREAIEVAFDAVLEEHIQKRKKYGFQPVKLAKKGGPIAEPPRQSIFQKIRNMFEASVPLTTIVNDGVIFLLLSFWAAGTQYAASDPTGPFVVALGFSVWRLFDKRQKRNPDGPYLGDSPIWGALITTLVGFILASVVSDVVIPLFPWKEGFPFDALGSGIVILTIGLTAIFVK